MLSNLLAVLITAGLSFVASVLALRQARKRDAENAQVQRNTNDIEATKVLVDGWHAYAEAKDQDMKHLRQQIKELEAEIEDLEIQVAYCRTNHGGRQGVT